MKLIIKVLLAIFILASFITHTIQEEGNPILSRITYSDVIAFIAVIFSLRLIINHLFKMEESGNIYKGAFIMVFLLILPFIFSLNPMKTVFEGLILFFLLFISIAIYQAFKNDLMNQLIPIIIWTGIIAASVGLYDVLASVVGLPRIFKLRVTGEAISGFRNAGQAGAYFLILLTILIPLKLSNLANYLTKNNKKLLNVSIILSVVFLFSTGKIAAYIGFVLGFAFYALQKRNFKVLIIITIFSALFYVFFDNLEDIAPDFYNRINNKISSRVIDKLEGTSDANFISANWGKAVEAFVDRPLIGSGLGAFVGNYHEYEVHSTYLKMFGETGLFGVIGYTIFIWIFLRYFRGSRKNIVTAIDEFFYIMFPFALGCLVSWGYTYHLRKREFWVLVSVMAIMYFINARYKKRMRQRELELEKI